MFKLSKRSLDNLKGVHPDLQAVVHRAIEITKIDFSVIEGLRTKERQRELLRQGNSTTMNSRHLTGHAVDLAAYVEGEINWKWHYYEEIAYAMKKAAAEKKVNIEWGGDWTTFKDGVHFQLSWKDYE